MAYEKAPNHEQLLKQFSTFLYSTREKDGTEASNLARAHVLAIKLLDLAQSSLPLSDALQSIFLNLFKLIAPSLVGFY